MKNKPRRVQYKFVKLTKEQSLHPEGFDELKKDGLIWNMYWRDGTLGNGWCFNGLVSEANIRRRLSEKQWAKFKNGEMFFTVHESRLQQKSRIRFKHLAKEKRKALVA